jgi:cobalamin biosynthesis Mg chelatase CobN
MTSNANSRPETPVTKVPPPVAKSTAQAPAVPISLYREVANELQSTKSDLHSLKTENQHLLQQNQQLRLEIERVVQSTLHLRQLADNYRTGQGTLESFSSHLEAMDLDSPAIASPQESQSTTSKASGNPAKAAAKGVTAALSRETGAKVLTGQESQPHPIPAAADNAPEISTWWLVLVVCLIVVSAFGMGFFIVRPLLPSR